MYKPSEEKKDYNCPTCKAQWTQLEVLDKVGPMGFECHRCGGLLEREEAKDGASTGHEKQSKLMSQLDGLLKMLQQIDAEDIPNNDFDTAFALAVPIPRDETVNPSQHFRPLATVGGPPAAVKGDVQLVAAQLDVSVTTNSERTAAEKAADAQRKADIAAQNVLPVWHTNSTVTGERMVADRKDSEQSVNGSSLLKEEEEDKKDSNGLNNELATYYAQLAKEKEQEAREDLEADESSSDDDDDDEGDFEDVGIGGSGLGTPSSSMSADINASQTRPLNGNVYRKASESGSSAPTHASTPTDTGAVGEDDEAPIAKKVKFESQVNGIKPSAEAEVDKDSDEDEEAEFEDAL